MSYELDPLPYDYDALEPHLSEQVLEWHHDTHHQGYVNGWNSAEETLEANREEHDFVVVGRGDPERDPQLVGSHPARPVLAEHEPGGRRRARWRAGRPDRGGLRLVRRLEGRVRGGGVRRVRLGALSVRHILEPAAERRGRQARPGRDLGRSRFWRWLVWGTPTTTTTARLVASSSTTSSRSSTGTSPRPATSRPSSCSSNAPRSDAPRRARRNPEIFRMIDRRALVPPLSARNGSLSPVSAAFMNATP